jgi:mediator of RNA polymerase II transcription subunit 16
LLTSIVLHVALSQNACVKASFGTEHDPKLSLLQISEETLAVSDFFFLEKACAAFVLQNLSAETAMQSNDDVLTCIRKFTSQLTPEDRAKFEQDFLSQTYRALGNNLDRSADQVPDKFLRYVPFQRTLSVQASLGYHGLRSKRTLSSKIAWTILQIRNIAVVTGFAFQKAPAGEGINLDYERPDILQYMTGLTAWSTLLVDYMIDQLFELRRILLPSPLGTSQPLEFDIDALRALLPTLNYPSLHLLLASTSRAFLKYNCRGLRGLANLSGANLEKIGAGQLPSFTGTLAPGVQDILTSSKSIAHSISSAIISPKEFEKMLASIEVEIARVYQPLSEHERQAAESELLITGSIPEVLVPVVRHILVVAVESVRMQVPKEGDGTREGKQEADLYFKEGFERLGLGDDPGTQKWWKSQGVEGGEGWVWDGMRKLEIAVPVVKGTAKAGGAGGLSGAAVAGVRTCTRCAAMMEDVMPRGVGGTRQWMLNLPRTCLCGGHWMVE